MKRLRIEATEREDVCFLVEVFGMFHKIVTVIFDSSNNEVHAADVQYEEIDEESQYSATTYRIGTKESE